MHPYDVIAIVGPTATGKSELADMLAKEAGSCVVSADSMQIYRGLDIGTAKVPPTKRSVEYFGIDIVDIDEPYSAAEYQRYARRHIDAVRAQGVVPVMCGGTGLYVRAALDEMDFPAGEQRNNPVREKWEQFLHQHGAEALHAELAIQDPESAELIDVQNTKRLIRAFEMRAASTSYAEQYRTFRIRTAHYETVYLGLTCARDELYARIERRVDEMMAAGLVDEVRGLIERGLADTYTARHAIGYREIIAHLAGATSLERTVELIRQHTRNYAKRQLTWFRGDPRIQWIDVDARSSSEVLARVHEALDTKIEQPQAAAE
ncbi:MAG: tRNA (adenosine(37)-N6)-dimethylallyltransferase MiaA [Coriobacteriia bacterium]|nr:tRNA (adenosine(37)-N6)-dimethylallyltransferase MiaA [Coriobacteriia bacterium]